VSLGGATLTAPGIVEQKTVRLPVRFGELDGQVSERAEWLHRTLVHAGIEAELSREIVGEIWRKFLFASFSLGLTALTRLPIGRLLADPETAELARGIMAEAEAVGRAKGVPLPADMLGRVFEHSHVFAAADPMARGSMYFDLIEGRRLELDATNGAIVRMGRGLGVPTPLNFAVYAALRPFAAGAATRA
jgi:2-dehydropantoate 2-reductase